MHQPAHHARPRRQRALPFVVVPFATALGLAPAWLAVPASAGKALSMIAEKAHVVREAWGADSVKMRIRASAADLAAIRREIAQHRKSGR